MTTLARMKTYSVAEAKAKLPALLREAERGEEVAISRHGRVVARLVAERPKVVREGGEWRKWPGWENYEYDPDEFAPKTEEELRAEGWDV